MFCASWFQAMFPVIGTQKGFGGRGVTENSAEMLSDQMSVRLPSAVRRYVTFSIIATEKYAPPSGWACASIGEPAGHRLESMKASGKLNHDLAPLV
jgi:hypothetical protein